MSSSEEESEVEYEEDEVIWAKIKGYPWWPAYVEQLHPSAEGETEYTVFFFGDTTHARLDASKLSKFLDNYSLHFSKARTNRALMASIMQAEQLLKENNEDVSIYHELRQELRNNSGRHQTPQSELQLHQLSTKPCQLEKARTSIYSGKTKGNRHQAAKGEESSPDKLSRKEMSSPPEQEEKPQGRKRGRPKKQTLEAPKQSLPRQSMPQKLKEEKEQAQAQQNQEEPLVKVEQSPNVEILAQEEYSANNDNEEKLKDSSQPRKRGRPKKNHNQQSKQIKPKRKALQPKRKLIRKDRVSGRSEELITTTLSVEDIRILQQTRALLDSKQQLMDHLEKIELNVDNIQEILEVGVVGALEVGEETKRSAEILANLKRLIILKYFPESVNQKKQYQKAARQKKPIKEQAEEPKQQEQEQPDIQKKTRTKLVKFIKVHPEYENLAQDLSLRIESYFQRTDSSIGSRYKEITYKVLSILKAGADPGEVVKKLEAKEYD